MIKLFICALHFKEKFEAGLKKIAELYCIDKTKKKQLKHKLKPV